MKKMNYTIIWEGEIWLDPPPPIFSSPTPQPQPLLVWPKKRHYYIVVIMVEEANNVFEGKGFNREEALENAIAHMESVLKLN